MAAEAGVTVAGTAARALLPAAALAVLAGVAVVWLGRGPQPAPAPPSHVGSARCAACHPHQHAQWLGSHHDLAMQEATEATVLGDFGDATFTHFGVTSTFFRRDGAFFVRTDGPGGELADYRVRYCFGVTPLQQYLVEMPGNRLQALALSWDTRPEAEGGQRWFHLYPDERVPHGDPLHWTARAQTWNHQCASCHSTDLRRGYDVERDRYDTTWSEIDVGCEACHGPGSEHVAWAEAAARGTAPGGEPPVRLPAALRQSGTWVFEPGARIASRVPPLEAHVEVDTCAPCHSRRSVLREEPPRGQPFLDTHRPTLLEQGLYYPDGQILEEVYVWGSFVQSKMHRAGVTCSDCHDPHGLQLRAPGNALCARCHLPSAFDTPAHHFHAPGSPGSRCVDCHMPARTYMVVDPRRDHGFRVPRPDLSVALGTPNACTGCHAERSAQWAADTVKGWYPGRRWPPHFAAAFHAAWNDRPGAARALSAVAADPSHSGIVRASALALLGAEALDVAESALRDADPLVRREAVGALERADPVRALALAATLLDDPVRSVRIEAAQVVERAAARTEGALAALPAATRAAWEAALAERDAELDLNADQPWAHVNRALIHLARGEHEQAESSYRAALRIDPHSVEAAFNLADLYRELEREDLAESTLRSALARTPDSPELCHALGLALWRTDRHAEAVHFLERAAHGRPASARYAYSLALALHETDRADRAIGLLEQTHRRHPEDRSVLEALIAYHRERGDTAAADRYAQALERLRGQ